MDIEGLGEQLAARLVRLGLVRSLADIYELPAHREDLLQLGGIGPKTLDNLFARIEASKTRPLRQLLVALGIRHIGGETATALAVHFGSMDALRPATIEDLNAIDGIGPIVATSIYAYVHDEEYAALLDRLQALGLRMDDETSARGGPLENETIVVTGSLERWSRDRIEALIQSTGDRRLVQWICERAGGFFIRNPKHHQPHPDYLIPATNEIVQEFADLLAVVAGAPADNQITPKEAQNIRARWEELKSVTEGFVACCEAGNFAPLKIKPPGPTPR